MLFGYLHFESKTITMNPEAEEFQLAYRTGDVNFLEEMTRPRAPYSKEDEAAIGEWASKEIVKEGDNFQFVEEIGTKMLSVYDAYITMQQQFNIAPIYDLEVARSLKRVMGMTHNGILQLQELAKSPHFNNFVESMNGLDTNERKQLWTELVAHPSTEPQTTERFLQGMGGERETSEAYTTAVEGFFEIPLALRDSEDVKFIEPDKFPLLQDYAKREAFRERDFHTTAAGERYENPKNFNRQTINDSKQLRILMEISQRNGSFATEEFDKPTFEKPNTHKIGEISEVLSLFAHLDPKKREGASESRNITNEAVFRATMAFLVQQHFIMNEIYKLPKKQFDQMNTILDRDHGFQLKGDPNGVIQQTLESGGGQYALFSNTHIRASKTSAEREAHYASYGDTPNTLFMEVAKNPSAVEQSAFDNTQNQRSGSATHIFGGGDIFTVPKNLGELQSDDPNAMEYMQGVEKHRYPVVAGISGTSARHFALGEAIGLLATPAKQQKLLTACLAFMIPLRHHSVHEVVSTLKSFNIPYDHTRGLVEGIGHFMGRENFRQELNTQKTEMGKFSKQVEVHKQHEEAQKWITPKKVAKNKKPAPAATPSVQNKTNHRRAQRNKGRQRR